MSYTFSTQAEGYAKDEVDERIAVLEAQLHEKTRMLEMLLQRIDETRRIIADTFPESYEQFEQDAEGDFDEDDTDESAGML
ncbi:MAG: hypothetical protein IJM13_05770 [Lachnospiraceae bacterium]|nr:hypothetical protein [Lachnospiraceae bacterium]